MTKQGNSWHLSSGEDGEIVIITNQIYNLGNGGKNIIIIIIPWP
jgi:hypothetical protein